MTFLQNVAIINHTNMNHENPKELFTIASVSQQPATGQELLALVNSCLDDNKAEDLVVIDLHGKSSIADYLVIASGRSDRHVGAMADHLLREVKDSGLGRCKAEGLSKRDWVLIDMGDIIVHLFRQEVREFYNLEKMWSIEMAEPERAAL